jgi:hypothetical protein
VSPSPFRTFNSSKGFLVKLCCGAATHASNQLVGAISMC